FVCAPESEEAPALARFHLPQALPVSLSVASLTSKTTHKFRRRGYFCLSANACWWARAYPAVFFISHCCLWPPALTRQRSSAITHGRIARLRRARELLRFHAGALPLTCLFDHDILPHANRFCG